MRTIVRYILLRHQKVNSDDRCCVSCGSLGVTVPMEKAYDMPVAPLDRDRRGGEL